MLPGDCHQNDVLAKALRAKWCTSSRKPCVCGAVERLERMCRHQPCTARRVALWLLGLAGEQRGPRASFAGTSSSKRAACERSSGVFVRCRAPEPAATWGSLVLRFPSRKRWFRATLLRYGPGLHRPAKDPYLTRSSKDESRMNGLRAP